MRLLPPRKHLWYFTPALGWGIFISYYTLIPPHALPKTLVSMEDKALHLLIYFFTAGLLYLGFIRYSLSNRPKPAQLWFIVGLCALYGGLIEIIQHYWVANRHGEWLDFWANTAGAVLSVLFLRFLHRRLSV